MRASRESAGSIEKVTDAQILDAYRLLGSLGVFCEPASAASVAGLIDRGERGLMDASSRAVCIITGHGLKDPEIADRESVGALKMLCRPLRRGTAARLVEVSPRVIPLRAYPLLDTVPESGGNALSVLYMLKEPQKEAMLWDGNERPIIVIPAKAGIQSRSGRGQRLGRQSSVRELPESLFDVLLQLAVVLLDGVSHRLGYRRHLHPV